ncbi:NADH dehydrogenase [ubiquinone] 1 alpha subcomplex subunit 5, partial [Trachymyrmex cornetzi]
FGLQSTYLTGLAVCKNPHLELIPLYNRILKELQKFPKDYAYRTETEGIIKTRLTVMQQNENIQVVEDKINCGQVEELIVQAKNELLLAQKMLIWKPWEKLTQEAPPNQWTWPPHK